MKLDPTTIETLQPYFPDMDLTGVSVIESGPMCWLVRNLLKQGAMTFSPFVFYGRDSLDTSKASSLALLAHELCHVQQYRRRGHAAFLARYWLDQARNRGRYSRDLPLEAPCYELQRRVREDLQARGFA